MFVEPLLQRQVIGISPEHGHRHMCVGVDKTGKHKHAFCIGIFRIGIVKTLVADVPDFAVFYQNSALGDDIRFRIHRNDVGVVNDFSLHTFCRIPILIMPWKYLLTLKKEYTTNKKYTLFSMQIFELSRVLWCISRFIAVSSVNHPVNSFKVRSKIIDPWGIRIQMSRTYLSS